MIRSSMLATSLLLLVACGDKDPATDSTPDGDSGEDSAPVETDAGACSGVSLDSDTGCLDTDGTATSLPVASAYNGAGSGAGLLRMLVSQEGNAAPSVAIDVDAAVTSGTLSCEDGPTIIGITLEDGTYMGANVDLAYYDAWCTIEFTSVGTGVGDAVEGTFTGEFYEYSTASLHTVSGSFKTDVKW